VKTIGAWCWRIEGEPTGSAGKGGQPSMVFWRSGFVQRRDRSGRLYLVNGYRNSHWGGAMTKSQCIDEARRHGARAVFTPEMPVGTKRKGEKT
jgi:hypothetical protein